MRQKKSTPGSSTWTPIGEVVDLDQSAELSFVRREAGKDRNGKAQGAKCYLSLNSGGSRKASPIDSEGFAALLDAFSDAKRIKEWRDSIAATERGPRIPSGIPVESAAPSPGAGLAGLDDRIAHLINCGIPLIQAQAMLGQKAPPVLRPVQKTSSVDLIAELSHGDPVLETVFTNMSRSDLAKAATASRS